MTKVSVIIPVYGVEKYILKCMDSIVKQTLTDIEIIVINDGTLDNSIKLIEENYNDNRIKIYNIKNSGAATARNYGVKKAVGEFLLFVDSDDFIDENCLFDMYTIAEDKKCNLVICDYYKYYSDNNKEHISNIPFYNKENKKCSVISMPGAVCKLINRKLYIENDIKFLENHCFEDNAIMPYLCAICGDFEYINKPYYYYLQRDGSALNKKKYSKKWEDIFSSLEYMYNKFKNNNLLSEYYQEVEYIYIEYLLHGANLRFLSYKEGIPNIKKISKIIKEKFPNWRSNKYYKKHDIKYKVMVNLFYYNQIKLINLLRRK